MMQRSTPFASLSSGLLARKGAAKPAMRPQGFTGGFEDLGWNDMGGCRCRPRRRSPTEHVPSSIAALTPLPQGRGQCGRRSAARDRGDVRGASRKKPRRRRRRSAAPAEVVEAAEAPARSRAGKKAAFTLRLDAERHLRLRLACAVTGRSAQQLVAGALDDFLATVPEIDALAAQVPAKRR